MLFQRKKVEPRVGSIYKAEVALQGVLHELETCGLFSDCSSSSSAKKSPSSSSANKSSSAASANKSPHGRQRPCVIWSIGERSLEVLPITSYNKQQIPLPQSKLDLKMKNQIFQKYCLSIESNSLIENKRSIEIRKLNKTSGELYGYILLKPITITIDDLSELPMPFEISQMDLLYINDQLRKIKADELLSMDKTSSELDGDFDHSGASQSGSTPESFRNVLSCFETICFNRNYFIEEWLNSKRSFWCQTNIFLFTILDNKAVSIDARQQIDQLPIEDDLVCLFFFFTWIFRWFFSALEWNKWFRWITTNWRGLSRRNDQRHSVHSTRRFTWSFSHANNNYHHHPSHCWRIHWNHFQRYSSCITATTYISDQWTCLFSFLRMLLSSLVFVLFFRSYYLFSQKSTRISKEKTQWKIIEMFNYSFHLTRL